MKRFKSISRTKKIVGVGVAVALTLGLAGGAFAYFKSTATNTNAYVTVGSAGWSITSVSTSGGPLYPNAGTEDVYFNVNNTGGGAQLLSSVGVSLTTDSVGVYDANTAKFVDGCLASWFNVTEVAGAPGGTYGPGTVTPTYEFAITLPDSGTDQSACEGLYPQLTISVS